MLRVFGAFLSIFCLLGMIVQLNGLAHLFGVAALALFALDLLLKSHAAMQAGRGHPGRESGLGCKENNVSVSRF